MPDLHFSGTDLVLGVPELSPALLADLTACATPGQPADEAVAHVLRTYTVTGDEVACRNFLRPYGAWSEEELRDHDANLARLVWLTGCGLREDGEAYFSGY